MAIIKPKLDLNAIEPKSERIIYKLLSEMDPIKTKDWVIYYSLCIKRRKNYSNNEFNIVPNSEIDFLILAPEVGIFVFEIKGGTIEYKNGTIYQYNRSNNESHTCDPFRQSKRNFYTLKDYIYEKSGHKLSIDNFVFGTLVGFPDMLSKIDFGSQFNEHDVFYKNGDIFGFIIDNAKFIYKNQNPQNKNMIQPSKQDIDMIVKLIEGSEYSCKYKLSHYIESVGLSLQDLTDDQKIVFNGIKENKRCLINGPAGTGKTILCEFLYKEKSSLNGKEKVSVIYFTFNRLISERLQNDLHEDNSSLCCPILDYIEEEYKRITKQEIPNELNNDFNKKKEFLYVEIGKIARERKSELRRYECLIIDEAQDLDNNDDLFDFLDAILNNGIIDGECYIFYDEAQNIFNNSDNIKIYKREEFYDYRYTKLSLFKNCRNSKNVKDLTDQFSNRKLDDLSKIQLPNDKYAKLFNINSYHEGAKIIFDEIATLNKDEEVKYGNITLLFDRKIDENNKIYNELKKLLGNKLCEYGIDTFHSITCSTVKRFKGLENDIIFYINDNKYARHADHYVALSRARIVAYIFKVNY